eukprot:TRINITY_DN68211_c0_g1_i1.p3 TRINITY_DN68211_c0_g1~~TRINITY_DN68211_c0_g1_i1.p3  ORF type:complete len:106 (+),score=6.73 TRINITY_DN68211_c0_g1_i1:255-572(+)
MRIAGLHACLRTCTHARRDKEIDGQIHDTNARRPVCRPALSSAMLLARMHARMLAHARVHSHMLGPMRRLDNAREDKRTEWMHARTGTYQTNRSTPTQGGSGALT